MMQWASKFDEEEVIECAFNKVDLYHQEQNDAPRIVQLVSNGDVETALQRIEAFGGDDKEGLQRKFILYMLCLMELTFNENSTNFDQIQSVNKILFNLESQKTFFNKKDFEWNAFFPELIIKQLISKWESISTTSILEENNKITECNFIVRLINKDETIDFQDSKMNQDWLDDQLKKHGIKSFEHLKKATSNEIQINLKKINNWLILFEVIKKLVDCDFKNKLVTEQIFINTYNDLSNNYRLLTLDSLTNILFEYNWFELKQKMELINFEDKDDNYVQNFSEKFKNEFIKSIFKKKWLKNNKNFKTFTFDYLNVTKNMNFINLKDNYPFKEYNVLSKIVKNERQFNSAFKFSEINLAYCLGKVFTEKNDFNSLIEVIQKKELEFYTNYIMLGVADAFNPNKNLNVTAYIYIMRNSFKELSIVLDKLKK